MPSRRSALVVVAACMVIASLGACSTGKRPSLLAANDSTTLPAQTTTTVSDVDTSYVAQAKGAKVDVFANPTDTAAAQALASPTESGAPLVFLLTDPPAAGAQRTQVYLPVRPNGSQGWVNLADVSITHHQFKMKVELSAHQITVTKAGTVVVQEPIGVGTSDTPTPGGVFYIKELLQPPDPNGTYGPYAYGLSGFSNVLTSFAGGDGVIGVHGTNQPDLIGKDVSHGCIRMSNDGITTLAKMLPLGVPVEIDA